MENNPGEFIYRSPFGFHLNPEDEAQRSRFCTHMQCVAARKSNPLIYFLPFHCNAGKIDSFLSHPREADDVSVRVEVIYLQEISLVLTIKFRSVGVQTKEINFCG